MDPFQALCALPSLIADYKAVAERLIRAEAELASRQNEQYVPLEWIAQHWSVTLDTARDMIKVLSSGKRKAVDIKVLTYGPKVVRYRRSDIERITNESLVSLPDMLAQKRAASAKRKL